MPKPYVCKSIGCSGLITVVSGDFCNICLTKERNDGQLSTRYPHQFKPVGDASEVDVFAINQMFNIEDSTGCIQHAIRKLLLSNSQASMHVEIREARDTLTRWLQLHPTNEGQPA